MYIKTLLAISDPGYLEKFVDSIAPEYNNAINILYSDNPFYYDNSISIMKENHDYIHRKLFPTKISEIYLEDSKTDMVYLKIGNVYPFPIEITGFLYNNIRHEIVGSKILETKKNDEKMTFSNFLFRSPADSLNLDSLYIICKVLGSSHEVFEKINPWPFNEIKKMKNDIIIKGTNLKDFDFLQISESTIIFKEGVLTIDKSLNIPSGYKVYVLNGTKLNLINSATIVSYSPIIAIGTEKNPVCFYSSDSTGQGLAIISANEESRFENVIFDNLSRPSKNGWELTGAITFYESPVSFNKCYFSNNIQGDDCLNFVRSKFKIENTIFNNIKADAVDADFCVGSIKDSKFINIGNDAIDISGSILDLSRILIDNAGDKCLSSGEKSKMIADNIEIRNSEIALTSKDLSEIEISNSTFSNIRLGYTVFQKKSEFGPGRIIANNVNMNSIEKKYLVEKNSYLSIDNNIIDDYVSDVKNKLYGVQYGISSK